MLQSPARETAHGGADGGRSHGGGRADDSRGPTYGGRAGGRGAQGGDGEPISQGDGEYPEGEVEKMAQMSKAQAGIRKAAVEPERQRTKVDLEGRRSLTEPEE